MSDRLGELFLQSLSEIYKNHYANYTSNSRTKVSKVELEGQIEPPDTFCFAHKGDFFVVLIFKN